MAQEGVLGARGGQNHCEPCVRPIAGAAHLSREQMHAVPLEAAPPL